jgi:2-hydroxy-3-keto-5-methylthiopentenyl-1-phosphate phosphatase
MAEARAMTNLQPIPGSVGVLVSDFDGTMTRHDFYQLAAASLVPPETPDHWARYRAGAITHFEALRA